MTYDTLNRLATKAAPSEATVTYSYDLNGHVIGASQDSSATAITTATTAAVYTTTTTYDSRNHPLTVTWSPAATPSAPTASSVMFTHAYDATNRRISQAATDNSWWSYPTTASTTSYSVNNLSQYSAVGSVTPTYDGNGNLTFDGTYTYAYDAENRLLGITQGSTTAATYAYDAQGRRKLKCIGSKLPACTGGNATTYVTDADNREVAEYNGAGGATQAWYAYGSGSNEVLNRMNITAGTRQTMLPDIQGSIIGTLDSSGNLSKAGYQPFGQNPTNYAGSFRYIGGRIDPETGGSAAQPSGLYALRARNYSPTGGRFLQPDPIGYRGGTNLYIYTGNDPLNGTDPSGLVDISLAYSNAGSAANSGGVNVYNHTYLMITDPGGARYVFEAGPSSPFGAGIPCFAPGVCGSVTSQVVPFAQSNAALNGTPHIVQPLLNNSASATPYVQILQGYSASLNAGQIPYDALGIGGNSNSAAFSAATLVTGEQPTPIAPAPGASTILPSSPSPDGGRS